MKPYDTEQDKKEQVREMFDRIAPAYDRLNHTLSFQIDKLWRRHVVRIVRRMQPRRILDVATGTGDLALAMARRMRGVQVLGVDLSENMLAEARRKATAWRTGRTGGAFARGCGAPGGGGCVGGRGDGGFRSA